MDYYRYCRHKITAGFLAYIDRAAVETADSSRRNRSNRFPKMYAHYYAKNKTVREQFVYSILEAKKYVDEAKKMDIACED